MELGPVLFTNPWGLLSLLSIPAILGIYYFRRTFRRKEISGLFLWENVTRSRASGSRVDRPPFSWNLLLQLLIAFLLSLLIAGPQFRASHRHHIMLIDRSASMHAEQSDGRTSFERAVSEATQQLDELSSGARVTLLATGHPTRRIGSDMMAPRTAEQYLSEMHPGYQSYDTENAIQQAYHLAGAASLMYFYTDQLPSSYEVPLPDRFHWRAVGAPLDNLAWTNARRTTTSDGKARLFVQLKNYSNIHRSVEVQFRQGEQVLRTDDVSVDAEGSWQAAVELDLVEKPLEVVMNRTEDPLSMDDHLVLRPPFKKTVRAGMTGLQVSNRSLVRKGLSSVPHVRMLTDASTEQLLENTDLMIGRADSTVPSTYDRVYLGVKDLDEKQVQEQSFVRGPYFANDDHPLLQNIVVHGLVFGGVNVEESPAYHTSLLSAGNTPLVYTSPSGTEHQFLTNFDPHYSTIKSSVAWPMLMTNLAGIARDQLPGPVRSNFRMDEAVELSTRARGGGDADAEPNWTLEFPDETRRSFDPGQQVQIRHVPGPPGTYVLRRERGDASMEWPFQVNFLHPEESNLLEMGQGEKDVQNTRAQARTQWSDVRPLQFSLIALLVLLCIGSWLLADRTGGDQSL